MSEKSGRGFSYRLMTQKLRLNGLVVDRETVRYCLKELDPDGVEQRKAHRMIRRTYRSRGPNFLWHMDGYDKLKPFGFCVHGAIDGYSRKILWLKVNESNSDPNIIASYFLDCIEQLKLLPRCIRADRGTENVVVCGMQRFLRTNEGEITSSKASFVFGPSTQNQRIEAWWSIFKRTRTTWWINFFKDLCDEGLYDPSVDIQKKCLQFCFMDFIQNELNETKKLWNSHRIRKTCTAECPSGRPDVLYFANNEIDCGYVLPNAKVDVCKDLLNDEDAGYNNIHAVSQLCAVLVEENNFEMPSSVNNAKDLYCNLIRLIEDL